MACPAPNSSINTIFQTQARSRSNNKVYKITQHMDMNL